MGVFIAMISGGPQKVCQACILISSILGAMCINNGKKLLIYKICLFLIH